MVKTKQKIAILGFSREGKSVLSYLRKNKRYGDAEIWILDKNKNLKIPRGISSQLGTNYLKNLHEFAVIFRSPGVPYELPELKAARRAGVKFSSATKLFFEEARKKTKHIIGITGTKGKGTTSTLVANILKASGRQTFLAGNIGIPVLGILPKLKKNSWVVIELSSFQLQDLHLSPPVAAVLHMFPDHQDAHVDLKEYYEAKTNIARHQKPGDKVFYFSEDRISSHVARPGRGMKIGVRVKKFRLFSRHDLKIPGKHNFDNAAMASTITASLKIPTNVILKTIKNYRGIEHRLEFVRTIGNIFFYNDSASTNPHTTAAALASFPEKNVILIAGGQDKNLDTKPITAALKKNKTAYVVLMGENKKKIAKAVEQAKVPQAHGNTLKEAVRLAYAKAKKLKQAVVVFSPGAASFDMFKNYADRGNEFKKIIKSLQKP